MFIDVEGFSNKFENGGKQSYIHLTNDLFLLGKNYLNYHSIIQFGGDGFLIKENLIYSNKLLNFIDISVALLKSILIRGGIGRVQISQGYLSDISGLYSEEIQKQIQANNQNILGKANHNLMMINTVIGTSIINCYKLKGLKGPLLLVDNSLKEILITENIPYNSIKTEKYSVSTINWIKYKSSNTQKILSHLGLDSSKVEEKLLNYVKVNGNDLSDEWKCNALKLMIN